MAAVEGKQSISEMYHLKEKEEVVTGESQPPAEEVTSETSANEEEAKEIPTEEEIVADTETTVEKETVVDTETAAEEETAEEESVEEPRLKVEDIKTAPADFRFPTTNQTRHCFTRYIEYHKCVASKGEDASECDKYAKYYRSLCPGEWIERWNEQRENGTFPGPL
ncbi:cytochrome c oxidase subunit 6b-1 [Cryptomeria japonica]|uniref:cytochrome c oxidase subunit 6b-1 n=1 Tax=Cryptomeria japonica TaxID=3369 RepID=UPI0025AB8298|nr:cytochrome c oxidase subunit 6b-1 [Cryptomeria japonica]